MVPPDHIEGDIALFIPQMPLPDPNRDIYKPPQLVFPQTPEKQEVRRKEHFRDVHVTYSVLETRDGAVNALRKSSIQEISYFMSDNPLPEERHAYISEVLADESLSNKYGSVIEQHYGRILGFARYNVAKAVLSPVQFDEVFGLSQTNFELPPTAMEAAETFTEILLYEYYTRLDALIDEDKLSEYERMVGHFLDYATIEGIEQERDANVIGLNGPVGAGKGTSLELLDAEAVETGTTGIAGRGGKPKVKRDVLDGGHDRYDRWEYVLAGFDRSRKQQKRIPTKLMRLWTAMELAQKRMELDAQGKYNDPIYISGYPRDVNQNKTFSHIKQEKMKSVYLEISEEEAVKRTLSRIIDQAVATASEVSRLKSEGIEDTDPRITQLEYYRIDDFVSFDFSNAPEVQAAIQNFSIAMHAAIGKVDPDGRMTLKERQELIRKAFMKHFAQKIHMMTLERGVTGKRKARYHIDMDTKKSIISASAAMGIETHIIYCDGKKPVEVTQEIQDYIGVH